MPANYAATTKFTAIDRVSEVFKRMGAASEKFGRTSERSFLKASKSASRFKDVVKGIVVAQGINRGIALMQQGIVAATGEFINFDQAVTAASAKFGGLNLATKEGQATLMALKKTARDVGAATQFSATEAAQGLDFLALAGFTAEQAMAALPKVVSLATVAAVDLATATDIASDALGSFGLASKDSTQLATNLARVNDVFAKTTATANTNLIDLFEAAKKAGPNFTAMGQSIETASAAIGFLANSGIKGEESGTQLKNAMLRLAAPSADSAKLLKKLGISASDSSGNFRDFVDIIGDFEKALKPIPEVQRAAYLETIFGQRSITGINILLQNGSKALRDYRSSLEGAGGAADKMAEIMRSSLLNRLKGLQSALIELTLKIFSKFETRGKSAIDAITEAVRRFDPAPIIAGIEATISIIQTLASVVSALAPAIKVAVGAWLVYNAVTKGAMIATAAFMAISKGAAFLALASEIGLASSAMAYLNAAMRANPIGLIITAVAALAAVSYTVYENWDSIVSTLKAAGDAVSRFIGAGSESSLLTKSEQTSTVKMMLDKKQNEPLQGVASPVAPNQEEAEAKAQSINFMGQLNIAGAPAGSTFENKGRGAPPLSVQFMGAQ